MDGAGPKRGRPHGRKLVRGHTDNGPLLDAQIHEAEGEYASVVTPLWLEPFRNFSELDGNSSDEESGHPRELPGELTELVSIPEGGIEHLGAHHKLNYEFDRADLPTHHTLAAYLEMSPTEILLNLAAPLFDKLQECSNAYSSSNITSGELIAYHALLTLRTLIPMDSVDMYWNPPDLLEWGKDVGALGAILSKDRYFEIRKLLKGSLPMDDSAPNRSMGWEVNRVVDAVKEKFQSVLQCPGEFLSLNEAIAPGASMDAPIHVSRGISRPGSGFRFFLLVDCESKVVLNFMLDTNVYTAESCASAPGGVAGAVTQELVTGARLPGKWYKLMLDNYFQNLESTIHMKDVHRILCTGTTKRRYVTPLVHQGQSKRPKLSFAIPRGSLKIAKLASSGVYFYSFMDDSLMYFIDSMYGPSNSELLFRRIAGGIETSHRVPRVISTYNNNRHKTNVFDQVLHSFGLLERHCSKHYTLRIFEILWSMIVTQAYNIYQYLHPGEVISPVSFKYGIVHNLLRHPAISPEADMPDTKHHLLQFEEGSYGVGKKRKRISCRFCPTKATDGKVNTARMTKWYCSQCKVGFHPQCFAAYHLNNVQNDVKISSKRLCVSHEPSDAPDTIEEFPVLV